MIQSVFMVVRRKTRSKTKVSKATKPQETKVDSSFLSRFKSKKFLTIILLIIIGGALFYFKGLFIAAIVNGQPITRFAVISELEKRSGEQTLSSIITETLILQEAQKRNITVTQKEIDDSIKKIESDLKEQKQSLDQALAFQGMARKDFEYQLRLRKLVEKMLVKEIEPTDKEISDYIEQNKDSLPKDTSEEEIEKTVKEQLKQQKLSTKVQEWLADLQNKASINYFVTY